MKLKLARIALKREFHDNIHCSQLPKELVWIPEILETEDVALIVQCGKKIFRIVDHVISIH